jgi:hypothetical protein
MEKYLEFRCPACSALLCKFKEGETPFAVEVKCQKRGCSHINIKANCVPINLVELRCQEIDEKKSEKWGESTICNKLLAKIVPGTDLEAKCPRCKKITKSIDQYPSIHMEVTNA